MHDCLSRVLLLFLLGRFPSIPFVLVSLDSALPQSTSGPGRACPSVHITILWTFRLPISRSRTHSFNFFPSPPHLPTTINRLSPFSLSPAFDKPPIELARPAIYYTALPHFPAILTIFYILYRLSLRSLRILPFSAFLFRTVQNVDASFLSLYQCCPPLFAVTQFSRVVFCAECTFSLVSASFLSSLPL